MEARVAEKVPGILHVCKQILKILQCTKNGSPRLVPRNVRSRAKTIKSCRSTKVGIAKRTLLDEVVHDILFWCQHITMIMLHRLCYAEPTVSRQRNLGHEAEMIKAATKV